MKVSEAERTQEGKEQIRTSHCSGCCEGNESRSGCDCIFKPKKIDEDENVDVDGRDEDDEEMHAREVTEGEKRQKQKDDEIGQRDQRGREK